MGYLMYTGIIIDFDDRILAHLQIVIVQKLRRGESFVLSWPNCGEPGGHGSAWLNPAIPLYFRFSGGHAPSINEKWLHCLSELANSSGGLIVTGEEDSYFEAMPEHAPLPRRHREGYLVHVAPASQATTAREA
jgi:hypothetical protein